MPDLKLTGIGKSFGATEVLRDISLELEQGELLVLLGPSGCGKSTLLRIIAGLETADHGSIVLGGREVIKLAPKERDVAMVFQNYSLYPHMTVARNLAFPLKVARASRSEIKQRVVETAELLGLTDQLHLRPGQLSGGQRQRVALGRAIIRQPALFLLDEPLSNLDAHLRERMRREIVRLQKQLQVSTIHVTHDQAEALTMADRVAILNDGVLAQVGTPEELYCNPANLFVAEFVGQPKINVVPLDTNSAPVRQLISRWSGAAIDTSTLVAAVRPEMIMISENGALGGTVSECEYLGEEYIVTLVGDGVTLVVSGVSYSLSTGESVRFDIDADSVLFFARHDGARIQPQS